MNIEKAHKVFSVQLPFTTLGTSATINVYIEDMVTLLTNKGDKFVPDVYTEQLNWTLQQLFYGCTIGNLQCIDIVNSTMLHPNWVTVNLMSGLPSIRRIEVNPHYALPGLFNYLETLIYENHDVLNHRLYYSRLIQVFNTIEVNLDLIDRTYGSESEKQRNSFNNNLYLGKEPIEKIKSKLEALKARYDGMKIPDLMPIKTYLEQQDEHISAVVAEFLFQHNS